MRMTYSSRNSKGRNIMRSNQKKEKKRTKSLVVKNKQKIFS